MPNPNCRCRQALWNYKADLAVALSMSVSHKNIFFDKKMPDVKFSQDSTQQ
jgi:hypothetical protein